MAGRGRGAKGKAGRCLKGAVCDCVQFCSECWLVHFREAGRTTGLPSWCLGNGAISRNSVWRLHTQSRVWRGQVRVRCLVSWGQVVASVLGADEAL